MHGSAVIWLSRRLSTCSVPSHTHLRKVAQRTQIKATPYKLGRWLSLLYSWMNYFSSSQSPCASRWVSLLSRRRPLNTGASGFNPVSSLHGWLVPHSQDRAKIQTNRNDRDINAQELNAPRALSWKIKSTTPSFTATAKQISHLPIWMSRSLSLKHADFKWKKQK